MTADVQREPTVDVLDELAYVLHGQGCGEVCVCVDDARALLPTVRALIADAEKRAAAAALRDMAVTFDTDAKHLGIETYAQAAEDCRDHAAALDPS